MTGSGAGRENTAEPAPGCGRVRAISSALDARLAVGAGVVLHQCAEPVVDKAAIF